MNERDHVEYSSPLPVGKKCLYLTTALLDSIVPVNPSKVFVGENDIVQLVKQSDTIMFGEKMTMNGRVNVFLFGINGNWIKAHVDRSSRKIEDALKDNGCT